MSKIEQRKILVDIMKADEASGLYEELNWKLVRERDGLTKESEKIIWIEFNEDGRFKEMSDEIAIGRSLLMSPFNEFFTWQTTPITEIVEQKEDYVKFKTQNSNYELFKL